MGHAILYLTLQLMVFNYLYIISLYSLKWQVQMFKLHLELNQKDCNCETNLTLLCRTMR